MTLLFRRTGCMIFESDKYNENKKCLNIFYDYIFSDFIPLCVLLSPMQISKECIYNKFQKQFSKLSF